MNKNETNGGAPMELSYEEQYAQWLRDTRAQRAAAADRVWGMAINGATQSVSEEQQTQV